MTAKTSYFREYPSNRKESQGDYYKMVPVKDEDALDYFKVFMRATPSDPWLYLGIVERYRGMNVTSGYANIRTSWTEPYEYTAVEDAKGNRLRHIFGSQRMGAVADLIQAL